jgi:hypothetical protein
MQSLWHCVAFHSMIDWYICALKDCCGEMYQVSIYQWFFRSIVSDISMLESSWNVMAHNDAWERKWRGNWRMEWVASTLPTTLEHGVSSITTVDAHTSAASSRLNWCPCWCKWTGRKTKSGFCACAITFHMQSTVNMAAVVDIDHWLGFSQTWCFGKTYLLL